MNVELEAPLRGALPVLALIPIDSAGPLPIVLFSTGAFSSPEKYGALLEPWAESGYAVLAPLHVDAERWTGARPKDQRDGLKWRMNDMRTLVAGLSQVEAQIGIDLDESRVAATGHSFGALVAQILGGAKMGPFAGDIGARPDLPIAAVIAVSPPGPIPDYIDAAGWAQMRAPQLLSTGTIDIVPMMAPQWQAHLAGHAAHSGDSWALVLEGVDHYFGNIIGRTEYPGPPQSDQFAQLLPYTKQFLNAFVRDRPAALKAFNTAPQSAEPMVGLSRN